MSETHHLTEKFLRKVNTKKWKRVLKSIKCKKVGKREFPGGVLGLGLYAFSAGGTGFIPGWGKILHAMPHGQKKPVKSEQESHPGNKFKEHPQRQTTLGSCRQTCSSYLPRNPRRCSCARGGSPPCGWEWWRPGARDTSAAGDAGGSQLPGFLPGWCACSF